MKLLIYSPVFYPSVGGIETVNLLIAQELIRKGYKIIVITTTPNPNNDDNQFNFKIDGASYGRWFRRKKDEFMETLGLLTSRRSQN